MATARRFGNASLRVNAGVHVLAAPLREIRPIVRQRRFMIESLDYSTVEFVTIGSAVYEIEAVIRYEDAPQALLDALLLGAQGMQVDYIPDVSDMLTFYPCILMASGDAITLEPDRDTWWDANYETAVRLRRNDGGTFSPVLE